MKNQEKLESLLAKGIITQEEFDHLQRQRNGEEPSVAKNILSFVLTVIAIGVILFGTCFMNLAIVDHQELEFSTIPLAWPLFIIAWTLFPVVLFGWIAHKTKNTGMKWAVIFLAVCALLIISIR